MATAEDQQPDAGIFDRAFSSAVNRAVVRSREVTLAESYGPPTLHGDATPDPYDAPEPPPYLRPALEDAAHPRVARAVGNLRVTSRGLFWTVLELAGVIVTLLALARVITWLA